MKKIKFLVLSVLLSAASVFAQGEQGINAARSELVKYVDPVANLILVIGAIVGLIGAIRVYAKWNNGDQDVNKALMGWGGSCVFLVVSGIVIKAFFNV